MINEYVYHTDTYTCTLNLPPATDERRFGSMVSFFVFSSSVRHQKLFTCTLTEERTEIQVGEARGSGGALNCYFSTNKDNSAFYFKGTLNEGGALRWGLGARYSARMGWGSLRQFVCSSVVPTHGTRRQNRPCKFGQ